MTTTPNAERSGAGTPDRRVDTHIINSQETTSMSAHQSKPATLASVQRPTWATRSRICDELLGIVYHSRAAGYDDSVSIELSVADNIDITDDGHVRLTRESPTIELSGGILDLDNAAVLAAKIAEFIDLATSEARVNRARAEHIHALLTATPTNAAAQNDQAPAPCPSWCEETVGHSYDEFDKGLVRSHTRDLLPDSLATVELVAVETVTAADDDPFHLDEPHVEISAELRGIAEIDEVIRALQAARAIMVGQGNRA